MFIIDKLFGTIKKLILYSMETKDESTINDIYQILTKDKLNKINNKIYDYKKINEYNKSYFNTLSSIK